MSNIDERIVSMQFNNKQFETGAKDTLSTMDKLKASLNFDGAKKGLNDLTEAGKQFNLQTVADGVESISQRFSNLGIIGIATLTNLTNKAVDAGIQMAKSLTIDPIKSGFDEYELKMGSIQTILANTAKYGTKLPEVSAALNELNEYADKTIYNFGDMTANIGKFTNAGIGIKDATAMIKGFSNEAASSGASAEGAAGAAYQLSQALSRGKITLQDWNSLANAGMGSANMKDGLVQIAAAMGTFNENTTTAANAQADFNGTLEKGWLSSDVMSTYLRIQAGEMDAAAMSALGLSDAQIESFSAQQKIAEEAATKVRSFTGLVGTLREAVGSGWSETFEIIIGDFDEATNLWTAVNDKLSGVVGSMSDARNAMLDGWDKLGGRQDLLDIGANLWKSIENVIAPIQQAWAKIFPPDGGNALKGFTGGVKVVTEVIEKLTSGLRYLQPVFEVLFGVFKIGFSVVQGVLGVITNMLGIIGGGGTGSVLALAGGFAALVAKAVEFINTGQYVTKFFDQIKAYQNAVFLPLLDFFTRIKNAFSLLFQGDTDGFFAGIQGSVQAFAPLIATVSEKLQVASGWVQSLGAYLEDMGVKGNSALGKLGSLLSIAGGYLQSFAAGFAGVAAILTKGDFVGAAGTFGFAEDSKVVDVLFNIRDALMGVKDAGTQVADMADNVSNKFSGGVASSGEKVTSVWTSIANAFKGIATFLEPAVNAISSFFGWVGERVGDIIEDLTGQDILALINTGLFMAAYLSVKKFMDQFRGMFESAEGAFKSVGGVFDTLTDHLSAMQNEIKSNIILKIAVALALLAASIWLLSGINVGDLAAATGAILLLMRAMQGTMDSIVESITPAKTGQILAAGATMVLLGASILILAAALKVLAGIDTPDLIKGLAAVVIILEVVTRAIEKLPEKDLVKTATAIAILGGALLILSLAILAFSAMDVSTVAEGLGYLAATLALMVAVMSKMPEKDMVKNAVAIGILAVALQLLATAILSYSAMDVGTVIEGLAYIGASLLVLSVGMKAMASSGGGAVVLLAAAGALLVLSIAMKALGSLSWEEMGKGLLMVVAIIAVFAGMAALLTPLLPVMLGLGIALGLLGAALALAGAGMFLFAAGFAMFAAAGVGGAAAITATFTAILELLPLFAQQLGLAVKAFAVVISEAGPEIVAALVTLLSSLLTAIATIGPQFIETVVILLMAFLEAVRIVAPSYIETIKVLIKSVVNAIVEMVPFLVTAGLRLLLGLIKGIDDNLQKIIAAGKNLIINFITGIGSAALEIANAAAATVIAFVNGLATAIRSNSAAMNKAGMNLADAIVDGMVSGLSSGVSAVVSGAKKLVAGIPSAIKKVLGIASPSKVTTELGEFTAEGIVVGLENMGKAVYNAATATGDQAVQGLSKSLSNTTDQLSSDMNLNPVIKPVIDLTDVEAGAKKLDALVGAERSLSVTASANSAESIATSRDLNARIQAERDAEAVGSETYIFNQTNNSPKAISEADTYRNTKNQLSQARDVAKKGGAR